MWVILAFLSAFLLGCYEVNKKMSLNGNAVIPVLFFNTLFSSLIFLPFIVLSYATDVQVDVRQLHDQGIEPYLQVKSPLDGYVTNMKVNLGTYLNAGEPICDIINKGETLLELTAYEKDLDYLPVEGDSRGVRCV